MGQAWSWSALESFETCPKRHWHLRVKKDYKEGPSEALDYGSMVHKAIERFIKKGTKLPLDIRHLEKMVLPFKEAPGEKICEQKLALNEDFELTGWFDGDVWVRTVIDLAVVGDHVATLVDWKTGKQKSDEGQLDLCAAVMFSALPEVNTIHSGYGWTTTRKFTKSTVEREELPKIWNRLLPRVKRFQLAYVTTEFPARPSGLCRKWCPVSSCPHCGS